MNDRDIRRLDADAFENQLQLDEYIRSLKERAVPFKFAYVGRAAYTHDKLVRSKEYGLADTEALLIEDRFVADILPKIRSDKLGLIDVGAGNGLKAALILRFLRQESAYLRYIALDYSETLLTIARNNLLSEFPALKLRTYQLDFETKSLEILADVNGDAHRLFLFLGQTLGNPSKPIKALENIREGMRTGDHLLVGVEMYHSNRIEQVLEHYRNEPFYAAIFNPLTFAGLTRNDGLITVEFERVSRDVKVYFVLTTNVLIQLPDLEKVELNVGDRILIGRSHRFTVDDLETLFARANLRFDSLVRNKSHSYCLCLLKPV